MPRYIDLDKAIKHLRGACIAKYPLSFSYGIFASADEIGKLPTADVVPKSEVEALKVGLEMAETAYKGLSELYHTDTDALVEARRRNDAEVAREIFEEIADNLRGLFDFFRQDDCIRESSAIMLAISEIAELKKKYVPDTGVPTKVSTGDICVVCGEIVPEGRQVCRMCEVGQEYLKKRKGGEFGE